MAMPYLMPGFTGTAGGLWTNFGAKSAQQLKQAGWAACNNPFLKVIGQCWW